MKKVIAIIVAAMMLLSLAESVSAADLDFMDKEYKSYDATIEFSMQLNKPLDIAGVVGELFEVNKAVDCQRLAESLLKATYTADVQAEMSDDKLKSKMAMAVSANVPIEFSDDLSIAVGTKVRMWMDYDFTDKDNVKYVVVVTNPLNGKYYTFDYIEMIKQIGGDDAVDALSDSFKSIDTSSVKEIAELVKNVLTGNAKISSVGNTRTIEMNGEAVGKYLSELVTGIVKSEYMKNLYAQVGEDITVTDEDLKEITDVLSQAGMVFADDAVSIKISLDKDGFIKECDEKAHIAFNVYELCKSLGAEDEDIDPLTKENSDIDITFATKTTFKRVKNVTVEMPTLTEENSYDLIKLFTQSSEYGYTYDPEYSYYGRENFWSYIYNNPEGIDVAKAEFYVGMDEWFDSTRYDEDNLVGETVTDGKDITITYSSRAVEETVVKAKVGGTAYTVNGVSYEAKYPFALNSHEIITDYDFESDECVYETVESVSVSSDVLETLFGAKITNYTIYLGASSPTYSLNLRRPNPGYDPDYEYGDSLKVTAE